MNATKGQTLICTTFEKKNELGSTLLYIKYAGEREYSLFLHKPGKRVDWVGQSTQYEPMHKRMLEMSAALIHEGYFIVKQEDYRNIEGRLRPEALELIRERFPIGCTVEIIDSAFSEYMGTKGEVLEIDDYGNLYIGHKDTCFTWMHNTFRKISD